MISIALLSLIVAFLVVYGSWTDLRRMTIPDEVSLLVAFAWLARAIMAPETVRLPELFSFESAVIALSVGLYAAMFFVERDLTIPVGIAQALLLGFYLYPGSASALGFEGEGAGVSDLTLALIAFTFGVLSFAFFRLGAGDTKIITALMLWFGTTPIADPVLGTALPAGITFWMWMALFGGVSAVAALFAMKWAPVAAAIAYCLPATARKMRQTSRFPFMVAIAPAALFLMFLQLRSWEIFL